jgi:hypothetical protein
MGDASDTTISGATNVKLECDDTFNHTTQVVLPTITVGRSEKFVPFTRTRNPPTANASGDSSSVLLMDGPA